MIPAEPRQNPDSSELHEPQVLGDILAGVLKEIAPVRRGGRGSDPTVGLQEVQEVWSGVVGKDIDLLTRVVRYRGGVLTVEVPSAPLKAELESFAREQLLDDLNASGLQGAHELRFR